MITIQNIVNKEEDAEVSFNYSAFSTFAETSKFPHFADSEIKVYAIFQSSIGKQKVLASFSNTQTTSTIKLSDKARVGTWKLISATAHDEQKNILDFTSENLNVEFSAIEPVQSSFLAIGVAGDVAISEDFGRSWNYIASDLGGNLTAVTKAGDNFVVVGPSGLVGVSTDDGQTWTKVAQGLVTSPLLDVASIGNLVVAVGGNVGQSVIIKSEDAGLTWTVVENMSGSSYSSVATDGTNFVTASSSGARRSVDGTTWETLDSSSYTRVDYVNGGFFLGELNGAFKYYDLINDVTKNVTIPSFFNGFLNITGDGTQRVLAYTNSNGRLFFSDDNMDTWTDSALNVNQNGPKVGFFNNEWFTFGTNLSNNFRVAPLDDLTFTALPNPFGGSPVHDIYFS